MNHKPFAGQLCAFRVVSRPGFGAKPRAPLQMAHVWCHRTPKGPRYQNIGYVGFLH